MMIAVAGILERDGKTLICQRKAGGPHPLKWEFPGGKLEPGESPEQAFTRELREELGIEATPGAELMRYEFSYPGANPILLIFMRPAEWTGTVDNRIFETIVWETREALGRYDFLAGDEKFLKYYVKQDF
jgi:8-oxo-dGTP diphosphatase